MYVELIQKDWSSKGYTGRNLHLSQWPKLLINWYKNIEIINVTFLFTHVSMVNIILVIMVGLINATL